MLLFIEELLELTLDPRTDLLEHERIFAAIDKITKSLSEGNSSTASRRIITALRLVLIRLDEICMLSNS